MNIKKLYNKRSRGIKLNGNGKRKISKVRKILKGGEPIDFDRLGDYGIAQRDKLLNHLNGQRLADPSQSELAQRLVAQYGELIADIWDAEDLCKKSYANLLTRVNQLNDEIEVIEIKPTPEELEFEEKLFRRRLNREREDISSDQVRLIFSGKEQLLPGQTAANTITLERK